MQVWAVTLRQRDKLKSNSNLRTRAKRNQGAATVFKAPRWSVNCTYGMYVLVYVHVGMYIWRKNERHKATKEPTVHVWHVCNELIWWSARYEIRAASSEDCVFVPSNLYDVTAP